MSWASTIFFCPLSMIGDLASVTICSSSSTKLSISSPGCIYGSFRVIRRAPSPMVEPYLTAW